MPHPNKREKSTSLVGFTITRNADSLHSSGEDTVPSLWYRPHP